MNPKKFSTPNLDAIKENDHGKITATSAYRASQADIALAVEAARVTVPDGVGKTLSKALRMMGLGFEIEDIKGTVEHHRAVTVCLDIDIANAWLESLTVAPKDAP